MEDSSGSSSGCGSGRTTGERELFRKGGAKLYLIGDGQESVVMQNGDFVMLLLKHASSPLAAVVAMVGDMQWPVGKDSIVVKGKGDGYSFSLPADLTFGVAFNPATATATDYVLCLQRLDSILQHYSTFKQEQAAGTGPEIMHEASEFWTRFARNAEPESRGVWPEYLAHPNVPSHGGNFEIRTPKLLQKIQQARRMSAVAKIFSRSVETGAINASVHVKGVTQANADVVVASVDAVAKVVEAVETAGRTCVERNHRGSTDLRHRVLEKEEGKRAAEAGIDAAVEGLLASAWTLNKLGLRMLFRTIASIHSKSNIRSNHSRSSWSSRLRLSSSASSSSVSSTSRKAENASPMQVETMSRLSNMRPYPTVENNSQAQPGWVSSCMGDLNNVTMVGTEGLCRPMPVPPRFNYGSALQPAGDVADTVPEPSVERVQHPQLSSVQVAGSSQAQYPFESPPRPYHKRPI